MFFCLGLVFLKTAVNLYILAKGDKETATQSLNSVQAFNIVGLVAGFVCCVAISLKNIIR